MTTVTLIKRRVQRSVYCRRLLVCGAVAVLLVLAAVYVKNLLALSHSSPLPSSRGELADYKRFLLSASRKGVRQKPGELPDNQPHDVREYPNDSQYGPDFMDLTDSSGTERLTPPASSADNVPRQTFPLLGGPAGLAQKQVIPEAKPAQASQPPEYAGDFAPKQGFNKSLVGFAPTQGAPVLKDTAGYAVPHGVPLPKLPPSAAGPADVGSDDTPRDVAVHGHKAGLSSADPTGIRQQGHIRHRQPYGSEDTLNAAYWRSPCSILREQFVGSDPLFPPCHPSVPAGVAKWGKYPYVGPFDFIEKSKNPCFYSENKVRCVPYFFLAGFSKCGTSDLYARVIKHPQVTPTNKEMKWFSRRRFPEYYYAETETFSQYTGYFNGLAFSLERDIQLHGISKKIVGDYSIQAINEVFEWPQYSGNEGCSEPRVINANHIRHLNPDIKIIVIMRHPVQRLYSRFLYDYKRATLNDYREQVKVNRDLRTPAAFHEFVMDGLRKYRTCFRQFSLRHCIYNRTLWEGVHGLKIQDSLYAVLLEDWLRVIPRDQFLFLRTEDFKKDTRGHMEIIFKFLALDPIDEEQMWKICNASVKMVGDHKVGSMLPETERILHQFFQPFINRLADLLDDQRFLWNDL